MIRLRPIGAAAFALALLALPTFGVPHKDPNLLTHRDTRTQLGDVNLAQVVSTAQAAAPESWRIQRVWNADEVG